MNFLKIPATYPHYECPNNLTEVAFSTETPTCCVLLQTCEISKSPEKQRRESQTLKLDCGEEKKKKNHHAEIRAL